MTRVYENQQANLIRPTKGTWVRIKGTLYSDDLGFVDEYISDDKIYVQIIPRIDPTVKKGAKFTFQRTNQQPFEPKLFGVETTHRRNLYAGDDRLFWKYKTNFMRNGFLYKPFTLKQINSVNIRPTPQEKNEWLDIYNKYCDDPTDKDKEIF